MLNIYFYSKCGTCRKTLELIESTGVKPTKIEYLNASLDKTQIEGLLQKLGLKASELIRANPDLAAKENLILDNDESIVDAMVRFPILIQRPIVETNDRALICRPAEKVLEILK